jgi:hypothetical protein
MPHVILRPIRLDQARFIRRGVGVAEVSLILLSLLAVGLPMTVVFFSPPNSSSTPMVFLSLVLFGAALGAYRSLKRALNTKYTVTIDKTHLVLTPKAGPPIALAPAAIKALRYGFRAGISAGGFLSGSRIPHTILEIQAEGIPPMKLIALGEYVQELSKRMQEVEAANKGIETSLIVSNDIPFEV